MARVGATYRMNTVRSGYTDLVNDLIVNGERSAPRDMPIRELRGVTLVVEDPTTDPMPFDLNRKLNPAIGAVEALGLIGGVSTPNLLAKVSPTFKRFMNGEILEGAYGPRVRAQLVKVRQTLADDNDTRQAVAVIYRPDDVFQLSGDLPCTLGFQFFLREGRLELHTRMRSNDVWWGWTYDAFQFTQLQLVMAQALGVEVGPYVHQVGSFHLYERDLEAAEDLYDPALVTNRQVVRPHLSTVAPAPFEFYQELARQVLAGETTASWYGDTLVKYL